MSIITNDNQTKQYKEFEYLINSNKDKSLETILNNLMESDIVNIEDLIKHENISNLSNIQLKRTLFFISRGNIETYNSNKNKYLPFTERMYERLRVNTFLEIISNDKEIKFETLIERLKLDGQHSLLNFLFEMFIMQNYKGKIDEENRILSVHDVKPRDFVSDWSKVKDRIVSMISNIEEYESLLYSHPVQTRCCNEEFNSFLVKKENEKIEKEKKLNKI